MKGTSGHEFLDGFEPREGEFVVQKSRSSAFWGTNLNQILRSNGIESLVVTGLTTEGCVESTARAANEHGYAQVFVEDAMSSMSAETHAFSVKNIFPRLGLVRSTEEVLAGCASAK